MSAGVLAVLEHRAGRLPAISLETLAAAQSLAAALGISCTAVLLGHNLAPLAEALESTSLAAILRVEHPLLARYTADAFTLALAQLLAEQQPAFVLFPHTYQVRDFAPALATRLGQVLLSDVTAITAESPASVRITRQLMQGKLNAVYPTPPSSPCLLSIQAGAFRADAVQPGTSSPASIFQPTIDPAQIRTHPGEPFRETAQTVDLSAAPLIVAVGRGIGEQENLPLVEELASALGAELAASSPICDNGWLPMERQVGSSGQTVAPRLYLAVGISGAIQHLVGMKAARTVVAINRDETAPIFEIADLAIVGDLFEIVPELTRAILAARNA